MLNIANISRPTTGQVPHTNNRFGSLKGFQWLGAASILIAVSVFAGSANATNWDDDDRIIVGPVGVHGFQRQTPDDAGVDVDGREVNLHKVFKDMGEEETLWFQHVMTLANPFFEGRKPGLEGNKHAANYIEFYFKKYGLEPAFPSDDEELGGATDEAWTSYRQTFRPRGRAELETDNVGGVLQGKGDLTDEWIVIGGHYDHTGYNRNGTALNPGADDNASGTSGMLILAKKFTEAYKQADDNDNLRSILFMAFSAEEMGLLGARHYVQNSTISADQINIMLNLDMIGRLRTDTLLVQGVGTAEGLLESIKSNLLASGLTIHADPNGQGPSDHSPFYGGGIPVLFFFTGTHDVYHRPGDHGYTVNPIGAIKITDLAYSIATDFVTEPSMLQFTRVNQQAANQPRQRSNRSPRLGILPDFNTELTNGVMVEAVFDNSGAKTAGILKGDIILEWNSEKISGGQDLMRKARSHKLNDTVTLKILREGEVFEVKVTLK